MSASDRISPIGARLDTELLADAKRFLEELRVRHGIAVQLDTLIEQSLSDLLDSNYRVEEELQSELIERQLGREEACLS